MDSERCVTQLTNHSNRKGLAWAKTQERLSTTNQRVFLFDPLPPKTSSYSP